MVADHQVCQHQGGIALNAGPGLLLFGHLSGAKCNRCDLSLCQARPAKIGSRRLPQDKATNRLLKNSVLRPNFRMFAMVTKGQRGDQRRRNRKIDYLFVSYFTLQTNSSRCRENFRDANQIVCRCRQHKEPFRQAASAMSGLAQAPTVFIRPKGSSMRLRLIVLMR